MAIPKYKRLRVLRRNPDGSPSHIEDKWVNVSGPKHKRLQSLRGPTSWGDPQPPGVGAKVVILSRADLGYGVMTDAWREGNKVIASVVLRNPRPDTDGVAWRGDYNDLESAARVMDKDDIEPMPGIVLNQKRGYRP